MAKIYVASSWKNEFQPMAVKGLKIRGHDVYDFRNPAPGDHGFHWKETIPGFNPEACSSDELEEVFQSPIARHGAAMDISALIRCDAVLMVLPCGNSSHLELGHVIGRGKTGVIWAPQRFKADLMYALAHYMSDDLGRCLWFLDNKI